MKNDKIWAWIGAAAMFAVLASCGSGSGNSANLRLVNATLTHASLDLLVNTASSITGVATDTVSGYVSPGAGSNTLQINDAGSGTVLNTIVPTLTGSQHYCVVAYESGGTVQSVVLTEDFATPASGTAQLRVYDVAPNAGPLDVYITDPSVDLATVTSPTYSFTTTITTPLLTLAPGTWRVRITAYGNKADLRMDVPAVVLTNQQVVTVLATPASGGALLNGSALVQQGAYSASRNTNTRVRVAAAVSGSASVAVSGTDALGTTVINANALAPSFGFYVLVPSDSALNISVNGNSVAAPATTLPVGGDATVLVYGSPTAATASLIVDDNTLPVNSSSIKIAMINGITGAAGTVTLTANTTAIGINVAQGAASGYVSIPSSTNSNQVAVSLSSSLAGNLITNQAVVMNPDTVYTILSAGDVSAPVLYTR